MKLAPSHVTPFLVNHQANLERQISLRLASNFAGSPKDACSTEAEEIVTPFPLPTERMEDECSSERDYAAESTEHRMEVEKTRTDDPHDKTEGKHHMAMTTST